MVDVKDNVSSHAPVDPGLVLPAAVQAQRDRANALMGHLANGAQPPAQPPAAAQQGSPPQPPPGLPHQPSSYQSEHEAMLDGSSRPTNEGTGAFDLTLPGGEAAPQQPPQGQPPQSQPGGDPPVAAEEWERRYHSINGRFQNEVPRLREAVQSMADRNQRLEQLLASTAQPDGHGSGNGNGNGNGADAPPLTADFTPQEIEDWGPDMLQMITRVADTRAQRLAQQLRPTISQVANNNRQQMVDYLDRTIPDWQGVNLSQEFMDWALLPDEFSGVIRRDLIRKWWGEHNGPRVAAFFRSFISGLPGGPTVQQPQLQQPAPAPAPQAPVSQRLSLTELAAPSGTGSAAAVPPAPAAKRVYKRSEITQFYQAKSLGRFRGQETEAQAVENDIFAAQREGRVVNG